MPFYFDSFADFITMGKHGVYVWSCWGIVCLVLVGLIAHSRIQRKRLLQDIAKKHHQELKRRQKYASNTVSDMSNKLKK